MRQMLKNPLIYVGVLIVLGALLLWLGAVVLSALRDAFPWFAAFGGLLIVAGIVLEVRKARSGEAKADAKDSAS